MDPRVTHAMAVMEQTLHEPAVLETVAQAVNLSNSRLRHLFKAELGVPPARYLHQLRLVRARVLLERSFLSVKQVMAAVGLNDPSHFSRDFRRAHGLAPSEVRQRTLEPAIRPSDDRIGQHSRPRPAPWDQ